VRLAARVNLRICCSGAIDSDRSTSNRQLVHQGGDDAMLRDRDQGYWGIASSSQQAGSCYAQGTL
jgi:hypothetical protein